MGTLGFSAYLYLRMLVRYLCKLIGISPLDLMESSLGLNVKDVFLTGSQESGIGKGLQHFLLNRLNQTFFTQSRGLILFYVCCLWQGNSWRKD